MKGWKLSATDTTTQTSCSQGHSNEILNKITSITWKTIASVTSLKVCLVIRLTLLALLRLSSIVTNTGQPFKFIEEKGIIDILLSPMNEFRIKLRGIKGKTNSKINTT